MKYYINTHMQISNEDFTRRYNVNRTGLSMHEAVPQIDDYASLINRVGGPWGWTKRPKYQNLSARLQGTRLFHFKTPFSGVVGYALTRNDTSAIHTTEIENFGLFLEHNGKGYGRTFMSLLLAELFKSADTVRLETRSTNHPKVVNFYQDCGFHIVKTEQLPDDLILSEVKELQTAQSI